MPRIHKDWLKAYCDNISASEAPRRMHFWAGVSAIAGALRRKVWFNMETFRWFPNFYIVFVAPPGVVQKSTTAGIAMDILREVPGVKFGPTMVTWPSLVQKFSEATEMIDMDGSGTFEIMSAMTLESSEFGNLLDPQDRGMVDLLVSLWDGKQGNFDKATKSSGSETVENPWINLIACTTPSWIAGNFPEYMIGGGFTSRVIFVYADRKERLIAYPFQHMEAGYKDRRELLVRDLEQIATLKGEFVATPDALAYGNAWYDKLQTERPVNLSQEQFAGYLARKQTHLHKLAMILVASEGDSMVIDAEHLHTAHSMLVDLEPDMEFVFSKIGKSETSYHTDKLLSFIQHHGKVHFQEAYRHVHTHFPTFSDFENIMAGCIKAGFLKMNPGGQLEFLRSPKEG